VGCRGTGPRVLRKKEEHWQRMEILSLLSLEYSRSVSTL
jgi:hypothetical protein